MLVAAALGTNHAQDFDLDIDLHSVDVNDVAPHIVKLSDAKCHASLLPRFLLENSLYFDVNEILSFQKLVGNLDKTSANLGRQHQRSLDSYSKTSQEYSYLFVVISYYFIPSISLKLIVYTFNLILLMLSYSLNNTTTLYHLS